MNLVDLLAPQRLRKIAPMLEDIRTYPDGYRGLSRVPFVNAEDNDILARVSARVTAGDIVPDGSRPFPKAKAPVTIENVTIANFKRSFVLGPEDMVRLARILNNGGIPGEVESFAGYIGKEVKRNRTGNYVRAEQAVWGMFLDTFSYNFGGTQFTVTWNKPADLKVTPGTTWATSASATPVTDIQTLMSLAADKYGLNYDRMEMPSADFTDMIKTTEFQNLAKSALAFGAVSSLPPAVNTSSNRELAARVLGVSSIEVFDQTIDLEAGDGSISSVRLLPAHKVLLSRKQDDGNEDIWQFNNGLILESIAAAIAGENSGGFVGKFGGITRGPVSYAIADLASAKVEVIDAIRGFPGTANPAATAVVTVG